MRVPLPVGRLAAGLVLVLCVIGCAGREGKRRAPTPAPTVPADAPRITMMSADGRFLVLSDRSVWQIRPDAQASVAATWHRGQPLGRRARDTTTSYRWLLVNPVTRSTAPARLGQALD